MPTLPRCADRAEIRRLLQGKPQSKVLTSKSQVAATLWDYEEDDLAARAIGMSDAELVSIENISAWDEDPENPLPMSGQRITHNHVSAFAAITLFEGRVRPLSGIVDAHLRTVPRPTIPSHRAPEQGSGPSRFPSRCVADGRGRCRRPFASAGGEARSCRPRVSASGCADEPPSSTRTHPARWKSRPRPWPGLGSRSRSIEVRSKKHPNAVGVR